MAFEKTDAIVIRLVDFSETSCVVTLFSRHFGKIAALAKGARRPKGPFDSALDLLTVCRIVFLHKSSDALDLLTEAKMVRRFRSASKSLPHLYAAYYIAELLAALTDDADPHEELFEAALAAITALDELADVEATVVRFELETLRILGHMPSVDFCTGCGVEVAGEGRVAFSQLTGGVLCGQCREGQSQLLSVSQEVLQAMRETAGSNQVTPPLDDRVRGELRGVMNHYFSHLMGRRPRMQRFLGAADQAG
jgi:DNA repair protein RecO (recombination protein O)